MSTQRRVNYPARTRIEEIALGYENFTARVTWYLRAFVVLGFLAGRRLHLPAGGQRRPRTRGTRPGSPDSGRARAQHPWQLRGHQRPPRRTQFASHVHGAARERLRELARQSRTASGPQLRQFVQEARSLVPEEDNVKIDRSRGQTVLLVDALAPVHNCEALVRSQVGRNR